MRTIRTAGAIAALLLIAAACGDDDASTTTLTTAVPAGGGANGSITFAISGDYEASGELPFDSVASVFSDSNWSAVFAEDGNDTHIGLNVTPEGITVSYGDLQALVEGYEVECRSFIDQNDSSGLAGSFECTSVGGTMNQTGTHLTVDFSGEFSGHP